MQPVSNLHSYLAWCIRCNEWYIAVIRNTSVDRIIQQRQQLKNEINLYRVIQTAIRQDELDRLPASLYIHYCCLNIVAATYAIWGWGAARESVEPVKLRRQARVCRDELLSTFHNRRAA